MSSASLPVRRSSSFRLPTLMAGWKISVAAILGAALLAWVNHFINSALGKSIPFAPFYPLMALVGYLGGARPVLWVAGIALVSVCLWQADLAGVAHSPAFNILRGVFAFIAATFAALSEALVRQRRAAVAIPTAALTALARNEDRQHAAEAGFDEHCAKPIEPGDLVTLVTRLLESKSATLVAY